MPEKATVERSRKAKRAGRAPATQAGPYGREEMHRVREGKHGARSTKQAIAIGLSKARRAGVHLPPPPKTAKAKTKRSAEYASRASRRGTRPAARRSRAISRALKRESRGAASRQALSRQARSAARRRPASARKASARRAVRTKGPGLRRVRRHPLQSAIRRRARRASPSLPTIRTRRKARLPTGSPTTFPLRAMLSAQRQARRSRMISGETRE